MLLYIVELFSWFHVQFAMEFLERLTYGDTYNALYLKAKNIKKMEREISFQLLMVLGSYNIYPTLVITILIILL